MACDQIPVLTDAVALCAGQLASVRPPLLSVCHIISGDRWAGAEVQVAALLRALCNCGELRVSAIVLNEGRLANELEQAGVAVKVIPEGNHTFAQILSKAAPFVRQQHVQILHSHRYKENLLAQLIALVCRIPLTIQTKHGMPEPFTGWKSLRQVCTQQLDRWAARFGADAIIAVSNEMTPALRLTYGDRKVVTIQNGIDASRVRSGLSMGEAKANIGCSPAPVIGIVGRLEPIKRVDLFLAMAKIVVSELPNAQFVLAGDGSLRESLISLSKQSGLEGNVHFLGHREDIHDVIRSLDALVMCSDHEGMPMVLLEAMWLGVPVIGREVGGIREVLENGRNGLTVSSDRPRDYASACLRLLRDHKLRESLCLSAKQTVQREFSMERTAGAVLQLYRERYEG